MVAKFLEEEMVRQHRMLAISGSCRVKKSWTGHLLLVALQLSLRASVARSPSRKRCSPCPERQLGGASNRLAPFDRLCAQGHFLPKLFELTERLSQEGCVQLE